MPSVGTNTVLANVSGKTITKVSHCTASTLAASSPTIAASQEKANVNNRTIPAIANQSATLALLRKPIASPTTSITSVEIVLRNRSAATCPLSTATLDIGSERNRSTMPFWRSLQIATAVVVEPNASVC